MDDAWAGLRALVALAERGSFSAAARELRLTRPAVSKAVSRLEERHGVRLVERSRHATILTEAGQALVVQGRRARDAFAASEDILRDGAGEPRGVVRLDLPPAFGRRWVLPALLDLQARHPGLRLEVGFSTRNSELVADGVDVAVRIGRLPDRAEVVARRLGMQPTGVFASPAYLANAAPLQGVADLDRHACLLQVPDERWSWLGPALQPASRLVLADSSALLQAVIAGHGIARLPAWMVAAQPEGALVAVLVNSPAPALPINALWPRGRHLPRRVRVVIDALVTALAAEPAFHP